MAEERELKPLRTILDPAQLALGEEPEKVCPFCGAHIVSTMKRKQGCHVRYKCGLHYHWLLSVNDGKTSKASWSLMDGCGEPLCSSVLNAEVEKAFYDSEHPLNKMKYGRDTVAGIVRALKEVE